MLNVSSGGLSFVREMADLLKGKSQVVGGDIKSQLLMYEGKQNLNSMCSHINYDCGMSYFIFGGLVDTQSIDPVYLYLKAQSKTCTHEEVYRR